MPFCCAHRDTQRSTLNTPPSRRSGVTLIELLVVILIISILASLILGVAAIAAETARENGTRHTVERLHTLLTEFYGTFKTRRVKLNNDVTNKLARASFSRSGDRGQATAEARLYALREMMLMEVPDRWSDVALGPVDGSLGSIGNPMYLDGRTELANVYLRRYRSLLNRKNAITGATNTTTDILTNQSAECLYMIITLACGDGEARAQFGEHLIGDTDGDGAPEFLDGWGHPISFLRWAPGFDSEIELNQNVIDQMVNGGQTADAQMQIAKDHDPFDVFRVDNHAFRLVPLIYSGGRDESTGLYDGQSAADLVVWPPSTKVQVNGNKQPYLTPRLTPYDIDFSKQKTYFGTDLHILDPSTYDETATDNIHNHLLGQR